MNSACELGTRRALFNCILHHKLRLHHKHDYHTPHPPSYPWVKYTCINASYDLVSSFLSFKKTVRPPVPSNLSPCGAEEEEKGSEASPEEHKSLIV